MFSNHTEAEMPISSPTVASVDQKLLLFALCYYYHALSSYMKHKQLDRESSCPFSRGCSSHSGKYRKSLSEVEVYEREHEYTMKVNYNTSKNRIKSKSV